jgi:hypothetical protein
MDATCRTQAWLGQTLNTQHYVLVTNLQIALGKRRIRNITYSADLLELLPGRTEPEGPAFLRH